MDELEEALKKKDDDMKQMEERYKKYLEKAKSVSIVLKPQHALCVGQQLAASMCVSPAGDSDPGS